MNSGKHALGMHLGLDVSMDILLTNIGKLGAPCMNV